MLAVAGAIWLQVQAAASGDAWKMVSVAVYGATLVLLYAISTAYHSVRGRLKRVRVEGLTAERAAEILKP